MLKRIPPRFFVVTQFEFIGSSTKGIRLDAGDPSLRLKNGFAQDDLTPNFSNLATTAGPAEGRPARLTSPDGLERPTPPSFIKEMNDLMRRREQPVLQRSCQILGFGGVK